MKRIAYSLLITALFANNVFAGWPDDWITQKTVTGPSSFRGQQRGYLSGGSVQARWRNSTDYPISIEKPHLRFGCGGIDAFAGSMSYLDTQYLVNKFNRILQNAPALAFGVAMDTLASQVSKKIDWLESQIDMLNSIQLDDCAMAKKAVTYIKEPSKVSEDLTRAEKVLSNSVSSGQSAFFEGGKSDVANGAGEQTKGDLDAGGPLASCPQEVKDVFLTPNSTVMQNIFGKLSLNQVYMDYARGHIGDLRIINSPIAASLSNTIAYEDILPCGKNDQDGGVHNLLDGTGEYRPSDGSACQPLPDTNKNFKTWLQLNLDSIISSVKSKLPVSAADQTFIGMTPKLPVYQYLKMAVITGDEALIKEDIATALAEYYAAEMLFDLYGRVINAGEAAMKLKMQVSSSPGCNFEMVEDQVNKLKKLVETAREQQKKVQTVREKVGDKFYAIKDQMDKDLLEKKKTFYKKTKSGSVLLSNSVKKR